jgi:hypothetical protein
MFPSVRKFSRPTSVSGKTAPCSLMSSEVSPFALRMSENYSR